MYEYESITKYCGTIHCEKRTLKLFAYLHGFYAVDIFSLQYIIGDSLVGYWQIRAVYHQEICNLYMQHINVAYKLVCAFVASTGLFV